MQNCIRDAKTHEFRQSHLLHSASHPAGTLLLSLRTARDGEEHLGKAAPLPGVVRFDLLDASLRVEAEGHWIVLGEVQKIPALLDEVHRLMESRRWRFALCGSSARKLRRGGANLLAGGILARCKAGK
ncbi:MAG: hypothetical protein HY318_17225 [Armatimonadetes bacterium]|nr:hypothetical protein [Armatimonadota bacterium]